MSRQSNPRTEILNMDRMAEDTEAERAAKLQFRSEARKIRSKELDKQREECDDSAESTTSYSRYNNPQSNSSKYSSRNSSVEPSSVNISSRNHENNAREIKTQILQLEEKLKNAMVANAQLDSEKQLLRYEVDLMRDKLEDFIDSNHSLSKLSTERKREIAYQRMQIKELTRRMEFAKRQIEARDELLTDKGLILVGATSADDLEENSNEDPLSSIDPSSNGLVNGDLLCNGTASKQPIEYETKTPDQSKRIPGIALVSKEVGSLLLQIPGGDLETRLMHLLNERDELRRRQEQLELQLEEQRERADIAQRYDKRAFRGAQDPEDAKILQNARAQAQEFKFKYQESLQKINALEGDIIRLEGQVKRNKAIADTCEAQEEELKQDKRRLQREVREMASQIEDLKSDNATLQKRLEKLSRPPTGIGTTTSSASLRSMREGSQAR